MAKVLVRFVAQTRDGSLEAFEVAGPELQLQLGAVGAVAAQLGLAGGMDVPAAARILVVAAPRPQAPLWHAVDVRNDSTVLAKAELHEIPAGLRRVQGVAVAPNAQHVAVSVAEHVYLYEMSGRLTSVLRDSRETVWCLQFSPTSEVCAAGSNDRHIRLYAAGTGELLQTIETVQSVSFFAFHPVRAEIASGFYDFAGNVKIFRSSGEQLRDLALHNDRVNVIRFSRDGATAVTGGDDSTLKVWDYDTAAVRVTFRGHHGWIRDALLTPDAAFCVSVGDDTIIVWSCQSGGLLAAHKSRGVTSWSLLRALEQAPWATIGPLRDWCVARAQATQADSPKWPAHVRDEVRAGPRQ
eukprot:TRINITY_DN6053_c0_g1_i6.p1 TRINITY_DN6053_c0_g1~~TRINITY_DN6053_c0_g1_i6.p1  ORF type:complete len:363 (-),score=83.45 TRINITY_DN6053_c0_g1_i6:35-1093(-)